MSSAEILPTTPMGCNEWLDSWHRSTGLPSWNVPSVQEVWNAAQNALMAEVKRAQGCLTPSHEAEAEAQAKFETWFRSQPHQPSSIDCWRKGINDQTMLIGVRMVEQDLVMRMPPVMTESASEAEAFRETTGQPGASPSSIWLGGRNYQKSLDRSSGCFCDPPGTGEEYCTGHCFIRADVQQALDANAELIEILQGVRHAILNNDLVPAKGHVILNVVVPVANAVQPYLPAR